MKKLFLFPLILLLLLQSCKHEQTKRQKIKHGDISEVMNISSYTGNAVVFFDAGHNDFYSAYFIPILEKDSNVFKKKDFDVFNAVKGRCSVNFTIGYFLYKLQASESRKKMDRIICNVHADYYAKIWISYKNYEELLAKRKKILKSDSCEIRGVYHGKKGKLLDLKILKDLD